MARGDALLKIAIVVFVVVLAVGVIIPLIVKAVHTSRLNACANNLKTIWGMWANYRALHQYSPTPPTGSEFWLCLTRTKPPIIDKSTGHLLVCPLKDEATPWPQTDYVGTKVHISMYSDGSPVGADKADNHGPKQGGNVLLKSGDVVQCSETDALWKQALTTLGP